MERKHTKGYASTADEVYERNPICSWCEKPWPCDAGVYEEQIAKTIALLEALADDSDWEWHVPYMGSSLSEHDFERVHCIREKALRRTIEQVKEVLS